MILPAGIVTFNQSIHVTRSMLEVGMYQAHIGSITLVTQFNGDDGIGFDVVRVPGEGDPPVRIELEQFAVKPAIPVGGRLGKELKLISNDPGKIVSHQPGGQQVRIGKITPHDLPGRANTDSLFNNAHLASQKRS
jgi:hypothetical protein